MKLFWFFVSLIGGLLTVGCIIFLYPFIKIHIQYGSMEMGHEAKGFASLFGMVAFSFGAPGLPMLIYGLNRFKRMKKQMDRKELN